MSDMHITPEDVGRKVWSFNHGWGEVDVVELLYIGVKFKALWLAYLPDGRLSGDKNQSLFWDELKFEIPERPKRKVKREIEVRVYRDNSKDEGYRAQNWLGGPTGFIGKGTLTFEEEV